MAQLELTETLRKCSKCATEKPFSEFYFRKALGIPRTECKDCSRCAVGDWRRENPDRASENTKKWFRENRERARELGRQAYARKKDSINAQRRAHSQANPGWTRERNLYSNHGIMLSEYEAMFQSQDGVCAICKQTSDQPLNVDHDHATGTLRALLCGRCNRGLGYFRDNKVFLQEAARYLERYEP